MYDYDVERKRERDLESIAKAGTKLRCKHPVLYSLTEGAVYTAQEVAPPQRTYIGFTFPAYVYVANDKGKTVCCHLSRFVLAETNDLQEVTP